VWPPLRVFSSCGNPVSVLVNSKSKVAAFAIIYPLPAEELYARRISYLLAFKWVLDIQRCFKNVWVRPLVNLDYIGVEVLMLPGDATAFLCNIRLLLDALQSQPESIEIEEVRQRALSQVGFDSIKVAVSSARKLLYGLDGYGVEIREARLAIQECTDELLDEAQTRLLSTTALVAVCVPEFPDLDPFDQPSWVKPTALKKSSRRQERAFVEVPGQQAIVAMVWPGVTLTSKNKFALHLAWTCVGGVGNVLDQRLRQEAQLAYSVAFYSRELARSGFVVCYAVTRADKVQMVERVLQDSLTLLAQATMTETRLAAARSKLITSYLSTMQSSASLAGKCVSYRHSLGNTQEIFSYERHLLQTRLTEVQCAFEEMLQEKAVTVIALPEN
jgi:hypothetical protein